MIVPLEHQDWIRRMIGEVNCPQESPCCCGDFENIGRVEPVGNTGLIECLASRGPLCPFGLAFGSAIFCRCPVRKYIFDRLHK